MVAKSPKTAMSPSKAVVATKKSKKQTSQQKKNKTMIPSPVDKHLVEKAVAALLKYHEAQSQNSKDLLGDDTQIQVQLSLLRAPANSSPKPIRIMIPNPFYKVVGDAADAASSSEDQAVAEEPEVCIIVKEESKPWVQDMIAKFPQHMGCVKKVLGLQSLRKKHAQYEQRRELLHKYNVFLADDRILPMLSKALGKDFFKAKKLPIPIALTRKEALPFAIQKALSATHMTLSSGTCLTIRAGTTAMTAQALVQNILSIAENAGPKVPRKWANIQAVSIKTPDSMSLPVYNQTPEILEEMALAAGYKPPKIEDEKNKDDGEAQKTQEQKEADKKRKGKSPLVRALKKQKQEEKDEESSKKAMTKETKKSKRKASDASDDKEETPSTAATTKAQKKTKSSTESEEKTAESSAKKEKASSKKEEKETVTKKTKKQEEAKEPVSAKKANKKQQDASTSEGSAKKSKKEEPTGEFIAAKKFKGSKKGYVFKMGTRGLGYYVDVKPVVDRMAMEALKRMSKSQSRRGGQKKNKYKGTRRF